jgi:hypothetical protein
MVAIIVFAFVNLAPWVGVLRKPVRGSIGGDGIGPGHASSPSPNVGSLPLGLVPSGTVRVPANLGMALLRGYTANRTHRACDLLPSNVTIALEPDFEVGMVREVVMAPDLRRRWAELGGAPKELDLSHKRNGTRSFRSPRAYVLMVSNHKYIDGALTMASSLRNASAKVQAGECAVVILVSESIQEHSLQMLATVFDRVMVMRTIGQFAKKSAYTNTFDKAYLFFLTDYERVMFLDADHIVYKGEGIDALWTKKPLDAPNEIIAVGDHGYFQTALMVVQPNRDIFIDIYLEFRYGSFNYNQWRARDGILLRNCLMKSVKGVGHPSGLFHFYGFTKPWFNSKKKPKKLSADYMLTYDDHYRDWWRIYETLHLRFLAALPPPPGGYAPPTVWRDELSKKWIKKKSQGHVDPREFMWLQRFNRASEYIRPVTTVREHMMQQSLPSLKVVVGDGGASCDTACEAAGLHCRSDALLFAAVNSQAALLKHLESVSEDDLPQHGKKKQKKQKKTPKLPTHCDVQDAAPYLPVLDLDHANKWRCIRHAGDDMLELPACNATVDTRRRVCACIAAHDRDRHPTLKWDE